jgi:ribonuclease T2
MRCRSLIAPAAGLCCLWSLVAPAEPLDATLVAGQDCPATVGIRRADNPGRIRLEPGQSYRVLERNRLPATHYLVRIAGAQPQDRWVQAQCGAIVAQAAPVARGTAAPGSAGDRYVLALSWQPAFCEAHRDKPECRGQTPDRPDARGLSLHGLWPQPQGREYCGVGAAERARSQSGDWGLLPDPGLAPATRTALESRMPGVRSHLERHEWTKHGTCYGTGPDDYFGQSMALLDQMNGSAVQDLIEANIGKRLTALEVRAAFDRAFGRGAGERVRLECDREGNIAELRIGLKGRIGKDSKLGELIQAAPPTGGGCRGGWVDRA